MNSIWSETCQIPRRDSLPGDLVCDAAVIGAGMAGILIAAALQQAGCRTVVLEADRIGGGQTRNTTAKITSQHGLIYQNLISTFGRERAGHYAQANEAAAGRSAAPISLAATRSSSGPRPRRRPPWACPPALPPASPSPFPRQGRWNSSTRPSSIP